MGGGGGRPRAAYAYRDLDEELFFPPLEHAYHSQESPLTKPLSESVILRTHFDKTRTRRRQLLLAVIGLLLLGGIALLLLVNVMDKQPHARSPLELAVAAPYSALRGKGNVKPSRSMPFRGELDGPSALLHDGPNVGDADSNDATPSAPLSPLQRPPSAMMPMNEEDDESDEFYYDDPNRATEGDDEEDRPWNGLRGYLEDDESVGKQQQTEQPSRR